jgi:hypothetical protein
VDRTVSAVSNKYVIEKKREFHAELAKQQAAAR